MRRSLIGPKVRDRRRALGLTQASLAAKVGISASYLNLIESNKRNIGGALLKRLADSLALTLDELDGAAERRLHGDLESLAGEPLLAGLHLDRASADDLASRHAPWARAVITLHRAWRDRGEAVSALSDRLSHDPFLGDAVHAMITKAAAIRSSAEILESMDDLEPAQRRRFASLVGGESRRLGEVAQALAAFFDEARSSTRSITPVEEVDDFVIEHGNHFPALEDEAARLRAQAGIAGLAREEPLRAFLAARGIEPMGLDAPQATQRFALARQAVEASCAAAIDAAVAFAPQLSQDAARRRARRVLASYVAGAVLLPYEDFHEAARASRYDLDALAMRFAASFEQVAHRLTTLHRPGAEAIPFAFMRVDSAGFITKRLPLPHLMLPRHGNACPLWAVYEAFQSPGAMVRQVASFPDGNRFLFLARTVEKARPAYGMPRRFFSIMLACDALHADQTVYGAGLDLSSSSPAVPVGANCRLCARRECAYREQDPIIDA